MTRITATAAALVLAAVAFAAPARALDVTAPIGPDILINRPAPPVEIMPWRVSGLSEIEDWLERTAIRNRSVRTPTAVAGVRG